MYDKSKQIKILYIKGRAKILKIEIIKGEAPAVMSLKLVVRDGQAAGIVYKNQEQKEHLLSVISGGAIPEGNIWINSVNIKAEVSQYRKEIDIIRRIEAPSTLTLGEYILLYGRIHGIYGSEFRRDAKARLEQMDLLRYLRKPLCELSLGIQYKARLLGTVLKGAKLMVLDDFLMDLKSEEREATENMIKQFYEEERNALYLSRSGSFLSNIVKNIILLN